MQAVVHAQALDDLRVEITSEEVLAARGEVGENEFALHGGLDDTAHGVHIVDGHRLDFVWRDLLEVTVAEGVAVKHGDVVTGFKASEFVEEPGDGAFASATAASGDEDHFHGTLG